MVYENYKLYGPYKRKDGREHVILTHKLTNKRVTVSYPKYLMETRRGRLLRKDETVDHIDCNPLNNEPGNLRILNRRKHAAIDCKRLIPVEFECPQCAGTFSLSGRRVSDAVHNRKRGKAGPFCSKSCAGKYSTSIQYYNAKPLIVKDIGHVREYTTCKKQSLHKEICVVDTLNSGKP